MVNIRKVKYACEEYYETLPSNVEFYDCINKDIAIKILNNFNFILKSIKRPYSEQDKMAMKTRLEKIVEHQNSNKPNKYNFAEQNRQTKTKDGFEHGRMYCASSLQGLKRELRHTIVRRDITSDIDGINMHPVILFQIALSLGIKMPTLERYINDRDNMLRELMECDNTLSRDDAKTIPLTIINFGKRADRYPSIKWLQSLESEMNEIYKVLIKTHVGKRIKTHIKNIKRLLAGNERKTYLLGKPKQGNTNNPHL